MERGSKNKFKMKSAPLRAEETIAGRFMAMGRALGNSKTSDPVEIDPSKYYKAPKKKVEKDKSKPEVKVKKVAKLKKVDLTKGLSLANTKKSGEAGTDINMYTNMSGGLKDGGKGILGDFSQFQASKLRKGILGVGDFSKRFK